MTDDPSEMDPEEFLSEVEETTETVVDEIAEEMAEKAKERKPELRGVAKEPAAEGDITEFDGETYVYDGSEWISAETGEPLVDRDEDSGPFYGESSGMEVTVDTGTEGTVDVRPPDFDPSLTASALRKMVEADDLPPPSSFRFEVAEAHTLDRSIAESEMGPDAAEMPEVETYTFETGGEMTRDLLDRIADEVEKREQQGFDIDHLVLGVPQYKAVEAWAQDNYDQRAEYVLPVDEVTVVPGPMIHPVIPNRRVLLETVDDD